MSIYISSDQLQYMLSRNAGILSIVKKKVRLGIYAVIYTHALGSATLSLVYMHVF